MDTFCEHVAFPVSDPEGAAAWYCKNFSMRIIRRGGGGDVFVADACGHVVFQIEDSKRIEDALGKGGVDYRRQDMRRLHLAFWADDVAATQKRLLAAGASAVDEVITTADGDVMTTIRDPWGVPIQIVRRKTRLV